MERDRYQILKIGRGYALKNLDRNQVQFFDSIHEAREEMLIQQQIEADKKHYEYYE